MVVRDSVIVYNTREKTCDCSTVLDSLESGKGERNFVSWLEAVTQLTVTQD